jgi:hypothetical protein
MAPPRPTPTPVASHSTPPCPASCSSTVPSTITVCGRLLARWFAHHGHSVLALDLPGHKRSAGAGSWAVCRPWPTVGAGLHDSRRRAAGRTGRPQPGFIDRAAGGAQAPERATHLAMLGTVCPCQCRSRCWTCRSADVSAAIDRVVTFSFSTLAAKPSFPGPGVWLRGAARGLMHQVMRAQGDARLFHTDFSACNNYVSGPAGRGPGAVPGRPGAGAVRPDDPAQERTRGDAIAESHRAHRAGRALCDAGKP